MSKSVRWMCGSDVPNVVDLHLAAFPGFFLSFLGGPFLKAFYASVLVDKASIALVAEQDGRLEGFVVGTVEPRGFYTRTFIRYWWRLALASVAPVLRQPATLLRLVRRVLMVRGAAYEPGEALLMSIAVDPAVQTRGTGGELVIAFLQEARKRGALVVSLTTDELNNEQVNRFYRRMGFACRRSYATVEGRRMNEYCREP